MSNKSSKKVNLPPAGKKLPPAKKPKWVEEEDAKAKAKAKVETKPAPAKKVETKPAKVEGESKGFHLNAMVVKSDPDFKVRDNTIAAFFKAAFAKATKVEVGVQDILDSGFTAPRSAVFKEDPVWFVRDHVSYFIQKGLIKQA